MPYKKSTSVPANKNTTTAEGKRAYQQAYNASHEAGHDEATCHKIANAAAAKAAKKKG